MAASGDRDRARISYDRALALAPYSADILLSAAAFYLQYGDRIKGIDCASKVLVIAPGFRESVYSYLASSRVTAGEILSSSLTAQNQAAAWYLHYFVNQSDVASAEQLWRYIDRHRLVDRPLANDFIKFLIAHQQYQKALSVWHTDFGQSSESLLFNGSFETAPDPQLPFDWAVTPLDHVQVRRDSQAHSGRYSLRLDFDAAANTGFNNASELAIIPAGDYELTAFLRSEGITTDSGVFLRVTDLNRNRTLADTRAITGSIPWTAETVEFSLPVMTLLDVRLIRLPSKRFDNKIAGTFWIDDLTLRRLAGPR